MSDELETRLRHAGKGLEPRHEIAAQSLHAVLAGLPRDRWSRRRLLALAVAAVLPSLAVGVTVGALAWPGPGGAVAGNSYPGPSFTPAAGWTTVATGAEEARAGFAPLAWATNVPLEGTPGPFGIFAFGGRELADLPPGGIVVVAVLVAPELVPAPRAQKDAPYVERSLPLRLEDADVRSFWEGQPDPDIPEYVLWSRVKEQLVDVRVFFGTQHPTDQLRAEAQRALERLQIPDPEVWT